MYIKRVQVEEGFLNGLDVTFVPGLNVIIGARGTGKTSLIELIRFCLDSMGNTPETNKRSKDHALSILGAGQVTVTLENGSQLIHVTRTSSDDKPRSSEYYVKPVIFSQTEIETVGLESAGRVHLIDDFISHPMKDISEEQRITTEIASLTTEAATITAYIEDIEKQLNEASAIESELSEITESELQIAKSSESLQIKTIESQELSKVISDLSVNAQTIVQLKNDIAAWNNAIKLAADYPLSSIYEKQSMLSTFIEKINITRKCLHESLQNTFEIWEALGKQEEENNSQKLEKEATARAVRKEIEAFQAGAGQVMRKGLEIREKKAKLASLYDVYLEKKSILKIIIDKRTRLLNQLEVIRNSRYEARKVIVNKLNATLNPNIKITLMRNAQYSGFASAISDLLRGSGLRYNDIIPTLAAHVSPRILLEAVDQLDAELIANVCFISLDRASRMLSHLRGCDLGRIGTIDIDDDVALQLLDGSDYKNLNELSTGQRCTVVLPLVLSHRGRVLVVDQPEDHIDNAFIASTVIKSILNRDSSSQIIFSTHNPNIPVLGNADHIVHLGSDGKHGFVQCEGMLNDNIIVKSISTVMEGGAEAFARRSHFYGQHRL